MRIEAKRNSGVGERYNGDAVSFFLSDVERALLPVQIRGRFAQPGRARVPVLQKTHHPAGDAYFISTDYGANNKRLGDSKYPFTSFKNLAAAAPSTIR
jgi:hypothetical protein